MTPETGREAECWIKLSLLTVLSVPEILRLLQQTGGVEALFDASSGTLTKLAGETAAREIREVNSSGEFILVQVTLLVRSSMQWRGT